MIFCYREVSELPPTSPNGSSAPSCVTGQRTPKYSCASGAAEASSNTVAVGSRNRIRVEHDADSDLRITSLKSMFPDFDAAVMYVDICPSVAPTDPSGSLSALE